MTFLRCIGAILIGMFWNLTAYADQFRLVLPTYPESQHHLFHQIIQQALAAKGHELIIVADTPAPQARIYQDLAEGRLDLYWGFLTQERLDKYAEVPVPLTNGLMGKRLLLVRPDQTEKFRHIRSLEDFRALKMVGGFGKYWYDAHVWQANHLPYQEIEGDWRSLYGMIAKGDRGIDYFSRSVLEIVYESKRNPGLIIEPHVMLVYQADMIYFLAPQKQHLVLLFTSVVKSARESGLISRIIEASFGAELAQLNLPKRQVIRLDQPVDH